jgi:purine-binding chemotaxis protein CheW
MSETRQYCTFYLENDFFGVDVQEVQEVLRYREPTRLPLAPKMIHGLINLRGQIVIALDLRSRLGMSERAGDRQPMNVVVQSANGGRVSLLVDEIGDVVEVTDDRFEPPPDTVTGVARELISGTYKLDDRLLLILDTASTVNLDGLKRNNGE